MLERLKEWAEKAQAKAIGSLEWFLGSLLGFALVGAVKFVNALKLKRTWAIFAAVAAALFFIRWELVIYPLGCVILMWMGWQVFKGANSGVSGDD